MRSSFLLLLSVLAVCLCLCVPRVEAGRPTGRHPAPLPHHATPTTPPSELTCADFKSGVITNGVRITTTNGACRTSASFGHPATCALPNEQFSVSVEMSNIGRATWDKSMVSLNLLVDGKSSTGNAFGGEGQTTMRLVNNVLPGGLAIFTGQLRAPKIIGKFALSWTLRSSTPACPQFGDSANAIVEVTCSNGIFCDGVERYVDGKCVRSTASPCDDSQPCTNDYCDEATQRCEHRPREDILASGLDCSKVAECKGDSEEVCVPNCEGRVCGGDGCGSTCGDHEGLCPDLEQSCTSEGQCATNQALGSCYQPYDLLNPIDRPAYDDVEALSHSFENVYLDIDTSAPTAQFIAAATCNPAATSGQVMAMFTTPASDHGWWIDARVSNGIQSDSTLDTVLELREGTCYDPVDKDAMVAFCNDDASPPGGVGSRVVAQIKPATTYYFIIGGYNSETVGPARLNVKFTPNQPMCLSRYCGPDAHNPGNTCGECGEGLECDSFMHCVPARGSDFCTAPLETRCGTRVCGDDGCGNSCGTCASGLLCTPLDGVCRSFPVCNHMQPSCGNCKKGQYCGTDCKCKDLNQKLPDILIDPSRMAESIVYEEVEFDEISCAFVEQCVSGSGVRKLLRFDTTTVNQGTADLRLEDPRSRPDEFMFGQCHNHYHYSGYARYQLVKSNGDVVATGHKQGYCMEDSTRYSELSGQSSPCRPQTTCDTPGISMGWSDTYGNSLDCQWVDITDVAPGEYILEVELNAERRLAESTTENNVGTVMVSITTDGASAIV